MILADFFGAGGGFLGLRVGLILLILLVCLIIWACFSKLVGASCAPCALWLVGASPSPPLWLWAPPGADFAHFTCFVLVWGGWWGARSRPLCGCGPLVGLMFFILLVFVAGLGVWWGLRPRPLCGYEPLVGLMLLILIVLGAGFGCWERFYWFS